jgi:hypothetical protein
LDILWKYSKKNGPSKIDGPFSLVGVAGFEPAALPSPRDALTGLRLYLLFNTQLDIFWKYSKKNGPSKIDGPFSLVGVAGFEPAALPSPRDALTGLRLYLLFNTQLDIFWKYSKKKTAHQKLMDRSV